MQQLIIIFRLARPLNILLAALTYVLGAGIVRYLGVSQNGIVFWFGLGYILLMQFSMSLLAEAHRPVEQPSEIEEDRAERVNLRKAALMVSTGALTAAAIIILLLAQLGTLSPSAVFFWFCPGWPY